MADHKTRQWTRLRPLEVPKPCRQKTKQTNMKQILKSLSVLALTLAFAGAAYAGECCTKAVDKAKKGETCAKCETAK